MQHPRAERKAGPQPLVGQVVGHLQVHVSLFLVPATLSLPKHIFLPKIAKKALSSLHQHGSFL